MEKEQENFSSWDFKEADTKEYSHGFHTYPARMIPQIARRLIHLYGKDSKVLLDPFCGSGTSIVEASITPHIKEAHGFDLNPLAILISKVKTTPLDSVLLNNELENVLNSDSYDTTPNFKNIDFWFKPNVIKDLSIIKTGINKIKNKDVKDFFLMCFSETVRYTSNTRNGEFKLYRIAKEKLDEFNPDVFKSFEKICIKNINRMNEYSNAITDTNIGINYHSSMNELPLEKDSVDLIVTSPPYGDSKTTVAYGQYSRLGLQWLDYEDVSSLDNKLLGGVKSKELEISIDSPTLKEIIKQISDIDEVRAREVLSFYNDFDKCVNNLDIVLKKGGYVCFVVGNRTVKGINIPTDKIMVEMFKSKGGYTHITTHLRAIPFKRMPSVNSPTNIKGETLTTMNNEFIFVLQKV